MQHSGLTLVNPWSETFKTACFHTEAILLHSYYYESLFKEANIGKGRQLLVHPTTYCEVSLVSYGLKENSRRFLCITRQPVTYHAGFTIYMLDLQSSGNHDINWQINDKLTVGSRSKYWSWRDSNPQSLDPKSSALSIRPHDRPQIRQEPQNEQRHDARWPPS